MDPTQARDHLELADRIVSSSTRELSLRYAAPFFIVWGLAAGSVDLIYGLILRHAASDWTQWISLALLACAVIFSAVYGRRTRQEACSMTFLGREFLNVLWIAMAVAVVANLGAWNLFPPAAIGALYTMAASIVLFYIGLHANRRALIGGIVLIVSLVVASFTLGYADFVLCAGFYVGYAGFGVTEILANA